MRGVWRGRRFSSKAKEGGFRSDVTTKNFVPPRVVESKSVKKLLRYVVLGSRSLERNSQKALAIISIDSQQTNDLQDQEGAT
jgi:hypothetical protein